VTYVVVGALYSSSSRRKGKDLLIMSRIALFGAHGALNFVIALAIKLHNEASLSLQSGRAQLVASVHGFQRNRESMVGSGQASIGNMAATLALMIGMWLNNQYLNGTEISIMCLAPILLLLNQDGGLLVELNENRRYFPVLAVISGYLFGLSVFDIFFRHLFVYFGLLSAHTAILSHSSWFSVGVGAAWGAWWDWLVLAKNYILLACTFPTQYSLLSFIWEMRYTTTFSLLCMGPLNIVPLLLTDLAAIRLLAILGMAGSFYQYYLSQQIHQQGLKLI